MGSAGGRCNAHRSGASQVRCGCPRRPQSGCPPMMTFGILPRPSARPVRSGPCSEPAFGKLPDNGASSHRVPRSPPLRKSATGVPSWMRASVTSDSSIALAIEGLAPHPKASASSLTESRGRGAAGRRCDGAPLILSGRTARPRLNNRHVASTALGLPSAGTFPMPRCCTYGTGCRCRTCGQGIMSSLLYR